MSITIPTTLSKIPKPAEKRIAIRLKPYAEDAIRKGHPWVYSDSILKQSKKGKPGDLVVVFDRKRRFLGIGLFDPQSQIRVRVLQHYHPSIINPAWFTQKIQAANQIRIPLLDNDTNGYRIVHGENDGLPGLIIDRYDSVFVIKIYSLSWVSHLRNIFPGIMKVLSPKTIILRLSREVQKTRDLLYGLDDGISLYGKEINNPVVFRENSLQFEVDPVRGQKTGFFLDQRENRERVEELSNRLSVLNVFAYSGGFSVYAARGGARDVTSIDINQPALEAAQRNFSLNRRIRKVATIKHEIKNEDAFHVLKKFIRNERKFGIVILDPPSFAKRQIEVGKALRAYRSLTKSAINVLKPKGILVQASCSSQISSEVFFRTVKEAARQTGRGFKESMRTFHPLDHPSTFKQGAYLKCIYAQVD